MKVSYINRGVHTDRGLGIGFLGDEGCPVFESPSFTEEIEARTRHDV